MTRRVITSEHTPNELVREYRLNHPLGCMPSFFTRLRMLFSEPARRTQRLAERTYEDPFFGIQGVEDIHILGGALVVTIHPTANWEDVEFRVVEMFYSEECWSSRDEQIIKSRAPSV